MSEQPQSNSGVLQEYWKEVHDDSTDEYISQQKLVQWTNRVFSMQDESQLLQRLDIQQEIAAYIEEVHQLKQEDISSVMFKYQEAVEFYNWINQKHKKQIDQELPNQEVEAQENDRQAEGELNMNRQEQEHNEVEMDKENKDEEIENNEKEEDQQYMYPSQAKEKQQENKHSQQHNEPQEQQDPNQFNQFNKEVKKNQQENQNLDTISKNYREYLSIVFDHYCRMSYATGNDPTFQQIQHKTSVMTINKFMIFCKEFGIIKLNSMTRPWLIQVFKKNSELYKEMNFKQFMDVLIKISHVVYTPESQEQPSEESKQFQQLLLFLQVNNLAMFKKKMGTLGISYRAKATNNVKKVVAQSKYKSKIQASNGRTKEEIQQQLDQRKKIRSQAKIKPQLAIKSNSNMHKRNLSKGEIIKAEIQQRRKRNIINRPQVQTHQPQRVSSVNKKLPPPVPPAKRSVPSKQPQPVITGYANIHRMKLAKHNGGHDSRLRLNQVVEDARRIVETQSDERINSDIFANNYRHVRGTPYTDLPDYSDNSLPSEPPSRQKSYSQYGKNSHRNQISSSHDILHNMNKYEPYGHSALQKRQDHHIYDSHPDLNGLLDEDQSDNDQFLEQHLNRERKNDMITQRIAKKIKEIEQSQ